MIALILKQNQRYIYVLGGEGKPANELRKVKHHGVVYNKAQKILSSKSFIF